MAFGENSAMCKTRQPKLLDSGIKVNSADPGYTARLALLPDDGPSGGFFNASNPQPW